MLRVEYRITYSADTVPFRIWYCLIEVLHDRSNHVKASVLWRHGDCDFIGFYILGSVRNVSHKPSMFCDWKILYYSSTYVRTKAEIHLSRPPPKNPYIRRQRPHTILPDPPPPEQHTWPTAANQIKVLYLVRPSTTVVNTLKTSERWLHIWYDFSGFHGDPHKMLSVTKLSEYCDWKNTGVHCPNVLGWWYSTLFHERSKAVANLRAPPQQHTRPTAANQTTVNCVV